MELPMKRVSLIIALAIIAGALAAPALAQSTPTANEINVVAKELWCPLCNGVRLDNCELQACVQMRDVISQKLAAGEDKDAIKTYFVEQYGDVVLGAPAAEGFSGLAWWLPILAGLIALGWLAYFIAMWTRRRPRPVQAGAGPAKPGAQDDYLNRVDEELKKYE
jgi:cytochrome c-type biogenesis protein CcmH